MRKSVIKCYFGVVSHIKLFFETRCFAKNTPLSSKRVLLYIYGSVLLPFPPPSFLACADVGLNQLPSSLSRSALPMSTSCTGSLVISCSAAEEAFSLGLSEEAVAELAGSPLMYDSSPSSPTYSHSIIAVVRFFWGVLGVFIMSLCGVEKADFCPGEPHFISVSLVKA